MFIFGIILTPSGHCGHPPLHHFTTVLDAPTLRNMTKCIHVLYWLCSNKQIIKASQIIIMMFWLCFTSFSQFHMSQIVLLQDQLETPEALHALVRICEHFLVFKQAKTVIHNVWRQNHWVLLQTRKFSCSQCCEPQCRAPVFDNNNMYSKTK